jgi:hypothetical protein
MRTGRFTLRFINQLVAIFSMVTSLFLTNLLPPLTRTFRIAIGVILFTVIFLGLFTLIDICFKTSEKEQ